MANLTKRDILQALEPPLKFSGYASGVCVCMSVCYHVFGDIVHRFVTTIVISFAQHSLDFYSYNYYYISVIFTIET